ncbi:Rieske (2Fe-2S) protein [Teredinibacter turnerae]|uniref:Rieske (2Fe-2S) protein n=1 Tax=Teredinibacter turnerae TaxID=2426 RepID=UPI00037F21EA|nr:Rieske (2Fe-2S) protein [Teredinibacter turnerae]
MSIKLFSLSALPEGGAVSFPYKNQPAFAVKRDGEIFAYINSCPHLGIPLEWQENNFLDDDGELIQCATHGALFLIETGECISGPCNGEHLQPININIIAQDVFAE